MEPVKLFDSELKLMELLWDSEKITAKELSHLAADRIGWNKNTTYTIIKKLIDKNVILRQEPNFICIPLVTKEQVQQTEANELVSKLFNGSVKHLFASFLSSKKLSDTEISELKAMIDEQKSS